MKVRYVMRHPVATLHPEDALDVADCMMKLGRFRHLPVVEPGNRLAGLVTHSLILRHSIACKANLAPAAEREWLSGIRAGDIMIPAARITTVGLGADLAEAVDLMVSGGIGCLPVVEGDELLGILTEADCLRQLQRMLRAAARRRSTASLQSFGVVPRAPGTGPRRSVGS